MIKKFAKAVPNAKKLHCNGVTIWATIADTDETRTQGLAGVTALGPNEGMLFDFGIEQPVTFWMKGCLTDLSIAFLTENRIIVGTSDMSKDNPTYLYSSPVPVRYAVEVPRGFFDEHNIQVGDRISF